MDNRPEGELTQTIRVPNVIIDPVRTFSDEWGVRDLVLTPSETRKVKRACDVLGMKLGHAPTGRTCQLALQQAMNLALMHHAQATDPQTKRAWWTVFTRAKFALGKQTNN